VIKARLLHISGARDWGAGYTQNFDLSKTWAKSLKIKAKPLNIRTKTASNVV